MRSRVPVVLLGLALLLFPAVLRAQAAGAPAGEAVVVAWFENRTGDPSLDGVGEATGVWLADALVSARIGPVVRSGEVRRLMAGAARPAPDALARQTGAGLLVRGAYTREGGQLALTAELVEVASEKVLTTSGPFRGPATGTQAVDALFQDLATALDMRRALGPASLFWPRPKLFAAWRLWSEASDNFFVRGDYVPAIAKLQQAEALDPAWLLPKHTIWVSNGNLGRRPAMDSMRALVRPLMTAAPGPLHDAYDWIESSHDRNWEGQYQAALRVHPRDPVREAYTRALPAARTGRFEEVVRLYGTRDTADYWVREWRAWDNITLGALHLLGRHEEELAIARENIARRGYDWGTGTWEMTALAALGRIAELDAAIARLGQLPVTTANTMGGALGNAASELLAHGNEAKARELFRLRAAYYPTLTAEQQRLYAAAYANSLLMAGNYRQAIARYDSLSRALPDNMAHLGNLGIAAVLGGDRARSREVEAKLAAEARPLFKPDALYWRSFMAALGGDCARAVELRREGLATGLAYNDYAFHRWNAFGKARNCRELPALTGPRS